MPKNIPTHHETWREDATGKEVHLGVCGDNIKFWWKAELDAGDIDASHWIARAEFLQRFSFVSGAYD